jgi:hypothetical protein
VLPVARELVAAYRGVLDRRLAVDREVLPGDADALHDECLATAMVMLRRRGRAPGPRVVAAVEPALRRIAVARLGTSRPDMQ